MKNFSPVFQPTDKPTRDGWYCAHPIGYYVENQKEILEYGMDHLLFPHNWLWYNTFWGKWFTSKYSIFPKANQSQYWFGLLKDETK